MIYRDDSLANVRLHLAWSRHRQSGLRSGWLFVLLALGLVATACSEKTTPKPFTGNVPEMFQLGQAGFNRYCARCHGEHANGTNQGPPLVHKIYEPNHHGDAAFYRAAANGVRAHHWKFGNMPKVSDVTQDDVTQIIAYVRWLQRQAGIF